MSSASPTLCHTAFVKNTFISIIEDGECGPVRQRSGSTPPAMKLCSGLTTPGSSSGAPCADLAAEGSLCSIQSVATTYAPTDIDDFEEPELRSWSGPSSGDDFQEPPPASQELCTRPRRMNKVRLNANAKAFAPSSEPQTAGQAPSFDYQVQMCVTLARSLLSSWPVVGTESTESKTGWSIVIYVNKQHERHINQVINQAKQAMLHAAKSTTNLYMFGYCKDPIVKLPEGFAIIFLGVEPQANTCWKFIQQGNCKPTCTADHPKYRKNVIFRVALVD